MPPHTDRTQSSSAAPQALKIRGLTKSFGRFVALRDINLDIKKGEFVCFLGPSGCGKTTLLRAIAGLDPQDHGDIRQNGIDISRSPIAQRDFGIVFQSYALFPNLTVERNVGYGLRGKGLTRQQRKTRIGELLTLVGLEDQASKFPSQLSGGQQQRVALARALAPAPGLLLLDEPLSALDAQVRMQLRNQLKQLQRTLGVTTILVTHDQDEALATADRIVVMNHGVIEQIGPPEEVYTRPATPFVARFLGDMNFIPARVYDEERVAIGDFKVVVPHIDRFLRGSEVNLCIRPAEIAIAMPQLQPLNTLQARIENVFFRGNFFRLTLRSGLIAGTLEMEVTRSQWEGLKMSDGAAIGITLPPNRVTVFSQKA